MTTPGPESSRLAEAAAGSRQLLRGGRYAVVGSLGSGAQGETLEAVDKREGRAVAIKRFSIRGAKSWKDVELAEREAAVLASLDHPSLPRYVEHFEEDGSLYLVMEKIEGESLAARRRRGAPLSREQVLRFLRDAAESLRYLHGHAPPIVHRDIKPGNVILRPDGSYCLVDFGSVRHRLKPEGGSTVVGTFGFMAPEQFQGRAAPGSDVYAAAATALSLLTGSEPEDLPHRGLAIDVEAALGGQADRRLIGALGSMLEPDPERRAPSVDAALHQYGLRDARPASPSSAQEAKQARRARVEADEHRETGKQQRGGDRAARKAERRARKAEQRAWRPPGRRVPPAVFVGVLILLALRVASFGTFALFQVFLPALFTVLSVFGGRAMYQRGRRMIDVGEAGQRGLARARQHVRHHFLGGAEPDELDAVPPEEGHDDVEQDAAPVESPTPRQRVSLEAELERLEADIEAELEAALEGRGRRRR